MTTLERVFKAVPLQCSFNVEVKYPTKTQQRSFSWFAFFVLPAKENLGLGLQKRNRYVDGILDCVFQNAAQRQVMFSSFDPDICLLLSLKQSRYPVTLPWLSCS